MIKKLSIFVVLALSPVLVGAGTSDPLGGTTSFFENALDLVSDTLIPLMFSLALLAFFYGIAKYLWSEGTGKGEGKQIMYWGVIALFVMSCVWGIVFFIGDELGVDNDSQDNSIIIPKIR